MRAAAPAQRDDHVAYHREMMAFAEKLYSARDMMPHRYVFILTNKCNLKCPFCFQKKDHSSNNMSTDDWLRVVEQLPDYAWITLTGGEPFLFKGFEAVFHAVSKLHGCNIITNGLLLTEPLMELLLSQPRFAVLSISVDSVGNTVRGVKPDQWEHTVKNLRLFSAKRDENGSSTLLDAKTMVLDENAGDLFEIHRYCMETLGCNTHGFQLLKGSPLQHADTMSPIEAIHKCINSRTYSRLATIQEQFELVRRYNRQTGSRCFTHPSIVDLNGEEPIESFDLGYMNLSEHKRENYLPCKMPWESVHINSDGSLFPCMAVGMGNVKTQLLRDIINGSLFNDFKSTIKDRGTVTGCHRCGYLKPREELLAPTRKTSSVGRVS